MRLLQPSRSGSASHRPRSLSVALAIAGVLAAAAPHAQETRLEEVIVTATALRENPLAVAQPVTVLGGDDLVRQLNSSIGETIEHELGVSATFFGPAASRPIIRGLGGDRVQVLQDGSSALDVSALSQDHAVSIEAALADQIEIIKGPATLLYGSAAMGGVINVIDGRLPHSWDDDPNGGSLEYRGDTALGEQAVIGRVDLGTERVRFHLDGFRRTTDDFEIPGSPFSQALREEHAAEGEPLEDIEGLVENSDSQSKGAAAGISMGSDSGFVALSVNSYDTNYGVPGGHGHEEEHEEGEEEHAEEEEEEHGHEGVRINLVQERYDFKAERTAPVGPFSALRLRAGYNEYVHEEIEPEGEVGTRFDQEAFDIRLTADHGDDSGWRGTIGMQYVDIDFQAAGEEAFVPPSQTQQIGLFVFEKRDFDAFTVELGARGEQQQIDSTAGGASASYDETAFSFSAGGIWRFAEDHGLALNVSRSERHPQAAELFADGPHIAIGRFEIGDPGLKTETATNVDLTLRRNTDSGITWSAGIFFNAFSDYIYAVGTGDEADDLPVFQYVQADAEFNGVEAEITFPLFAAAGGELDMRLAGDYVRGELKDGGNLPQMPPLRVGVELHYERDALHIGVENFYYDKQDRLAENELPTDSFNMLAADVSYRWDVAAGGSMILFLRGNNLLDEEARRHSSPLKDSVPLPGRSLTAGLRVTF